MPFRSIAFGAADVLRHGGGADALAQASTPPPNILLLYVDDLRGDGLGVTGHPFALTPNIDSIGHNGTVFDNSFVTTPVCSPARGSLMTGQYASTHGIAYNEQPNGVSDNPRPSISSNSGPRATARA
jgi:arylsulfatase A-like enzyme